MNGGKSRWDSGISTDGLVLATMVVPMGIVGDGRLHADL